MRRNKSMNALAENEFHSSLTEPESLTLRVQMPGIDPSQSPVLQVSSFDSIRAVKAFLFRKINVLRPLLPSRFVMSFNDEQLLEDFLRFATVNPTIQNKWLAREVIDISLSAIGQKLVETDVSDQKLRRDPSQQIKWSPFTKVVDFSLTSSTYGFAELEQFTDLIDQLPRVEALIFPKVSKDAADLLLATLDRVLINNSVVSKLTIDFSDFDELPESIAIRYKRIQSRVQRNQNKQFGVHGGGNIGLGLVADVVSRSPYNYKIVATSSKDWMSSLINSNNKVWLQHETDLSADVEEHNTVRTTCVSKVTMIGRDQSDVLKLYLESCLVAIAVTPVVLNGISKSIATALYERFKSDGSGVKILCCLNIPNPAQFVANKISQEMLTLTGGDRRKTELIMSGIDFIPTVIDRIVSPLPENTVMKHLFDQLVIKLGDEKQAKETMNSPEQLHATIALFDLKFPMFSAEEKYGFWVPSNLPEASLIPLLKPVTDLATIELLKNKFINGPHAVMAWLGALLNRNTIAEAISHPLIHSFIKEMMENEIAPVLTSAYSEISRSDLDEMKDMFFDRCKASVNDPVARVARDPLRKLDRGGRIRGTIELAKISTPRLLLGTAAGFIYGIKAMDANNPDCQLMSEIYSEHNNSFMSVLCFKGTSPTGTFSGFDVNVDKPLIDQVLKHMQGLNEWYEKRHLPAPPKKQSDDPAFLKQQLATYGIDLDTNTGHLSYGQTFKPLQVDYDLLFVRHGETYGNCGFATADGKIDIELVATGKKDKDKRIYQGNVDTEINQLTELGKKQAESVAEQLTNKYCNSGWVPDIVFLSPLGRAKDTAEPFLKKNSSKLDDATIIHHGIVEMSFGSWDNKRVCDLPPNDICHLFYKDQNSLVKSSSAHSPIPKDEDDGYGPPAESFCEVLLRAFDVLVGLNKQYAGKKVVMFSHSMFGAACSILMGKCQKIENGTYLAFDGKKSDGTYYTMPFATPFPLNFVPPKPIPTAFDRESSALFMGTLVSYDRNDVLTYH